MFRRVSVSILLVVLLIEGVYAVFKRKNDFECHVDFGHHFRAGEPYRSAGNYYPLARVMVDSLLSFTPVRVSRALCFPLAVGSLLASFWIWQRAAITTQRLPSLDRWPAMVLAIVVTLPFLLRDLDECGLQAILLLFLSLGLWAIQNGRPWLCGLSVAAAATYKATPLLFLPFLLWKRQWKAAGSMVVCTMILNLTPALWLGWGKTMEAHQYWYSHVTRIMRETPEAYPSIPGIEAPKTINVSLASAIARYVETYPPGHSLYVDHPWFVQFGNLPVEQSKPLVKGLTLLLGAVLAWNMRRRWTPGDPRLPVEWAVACIFSALLSPICWKQHLVLIFPAFYLIAVDLVGTDAKQRARWLTLAVITAFFYTRRSIVGMQLDGLLITYHLITFGILAGVWLLLRTSAGRCIGASLWRSGASPAAGCPEMPLPRAA